MASSRTLTHLFIALLPLAVGPGNGAYAAERKIEITFANWAAAEGTTKPAIETIARSRFRIAKTSLYVIG